MEFHSKGLTLSAAALIALTASQPALAPAPVDPQIVGIVIAANNFARDFSLDGFRSCFPPARE